MLVAVHLHHRFVLGRVEMLAQHALAEVIEFSLKPLQIFQVVGGLDARLIQVILNLSHLGFGSVYLLFDFFVRLLFILVFHFSSSTTSASITSPSAASPPSPSAFCSLP